MYYLELLGFIWEDETLGTWRKVLARRTIDPPKKETANRLITAILKVDQCSPRVNDLISEIMRGYFEELHEKNKKKAEKSYSWSEAQIKQIQESNRISEPNPPSQEKQMADKNKKRQKDNAIYKEGLIEISGADFSAKIAIRDKYGNRWVKCKTCSAIKRDYEMPTYTFGLGECKNCISTQSELQNVETI
jgi:hypothetical protein